MTVLHDLSETDALDAHFIAKREAELAMAKGAARGELARRVGVASLLGGAGLGLALFGASFLVAPKERIVMLPGKETVRETVREVPAPKDVKAPQSPYAARTPDENKFVDQPEYKTAKYHGRIVKSRDGHELSFEDGMDFHPAHWDDATRKIVWDPTDVIASDPYIGDLGMCVPEKGHTGMWDCTTMHNGRVVQVTGPTLDQRSSAGPTPPATEMVVVDIKVGDYPVAATVDTGDSFPMSVPKTYADTLIRASLATKAGSSSTTFADGSRHDIGIIMIKSINVDGRVLRDVEASVSPGDQAPVLLGLGALNRLGQFTIKDGRIVFS